jgi:hypothetical protein
MTYTIWVDSETEDRVNQEFQINGKIEGCTISNNLVTKGKYSIPVNRCLLIFDES